MDKKTEILATISSALHDGTITRGDINRLLKDHSSKDSVEATSDRLSAVDVMFYIAGIVLFAAIAALITQAWDSGPSVRIFLSAGLGTVFWAIALYLIRLKSDDDIRSGITKALLITGSFSIITGGFIIMNEFISLEGDYDLYAVSLTLALLGALHIGFGWQIKRDILLLLGALLATASLPLLAFAALKDSDVPIYVYCLITAASGALLAYITRLLAWAKTSTTRSVGKVFDPLSAFVVLMSLYVASYDDTTGAVWLLALIFGTIGLFYLSIISQNKLLLGSGSFFLVLSIITISYRYFSDNPAIALLISAAGLLGTAIMAAHINRRYLK